MKLFASLSVLLVLAFAAGAMIVGCQSATTSATTQPTIVANPTPQSVFTTVQNIAKQAEAVADLLASTGTLPAAEVNTAKSALEDALAIWQASIEVNPPTGAAAVSPKKAASTVHQKIAELETLIAKGQGS